MKRFLMRHICLIILFLTIGSGYSQGAQIHECRDLSVAGNESYITGDRSADNIIGSLCQSIDLLRNLSCESPKTGNRTSQITKNKEKDLFLIYKYFSAQNEYSFDKKDPKLILKTFEDVLAARHLNGFYIYSLEKLII